MRYGFPMSFAVTFSLASPFHMYPGPWPSLTSVRRLVSVSCLSQSGLWFLVLGDPRACEDPGFLSPCWFSEAVALGGHSRTWWGTCCSSRCDQRSHRPCISPMHGKGDTRESQRDLGTSPPSVLVKVQMCFNVLSLERTHSAQWVSTSNGCSSVHGRDKHT